jgi:BirA family transcriptional regulator, biotin operon repressor / biotin---[acetyl-CoA-carboxylase] ligase
MDPAPLISLLADGHFHSGEALGRQLGVSRTAVWKQIRVLRSLGIELHSVIGKGYRLPEPMTLLSREAILSQLSVEPARVNECFDVYLTINSTNTVAMEHAQRGALIHLVLAEHQSQGRGRRGRTWVSPFGRNIYLSLVWSFQNGVAALEGLSLLVALAVVRALKRLGVHGLALKWPNDVLLDGSKLAGILLEIQGDMTGPCRVVIGIGLNVQMPRAAAAHIDQAFSDLQASAVMLDRNRIAAALIDELFSALDSFDAHGFAPCREEWEALDLYKGREVEVHSGNSTIRGIVKGVDAGGALLLNTASGLQVINGGEVFPSLRPITAPSP